MRIERLGIRDTQTAAALLSIIYPTVYATRNSFLSPDAKARQLLVAYKMIAGMQKET